MTYFVVNGKHSHQTVSESTCLQSINWAAATIPSIHLLMIGITLRSMSADDSMNFCTLQIRFSSMSCSCCNNRSINRYIYSTPVGLKDLLTRCRIFSSRSKWHKKWRWYTISNCLWLVSLLSVPIGVLSLSTRWQKCIQPVYLCLTRCCLKDTG